MKRMDDERMKSCLSSFDISDDATDDLLNELRRARASGARLLEALKTARHRMRRVKQKCEFDGYDRHEVNARMAEGVEIADAAIRAAEEGTK